MSKHIEYTNDVRKITDDQLRNSSVIVHNILKSEVEKKDFKNTEYLFQRLQTIKTDAKGKILILFAGYDDNPEEIYSILEIRSFMKDLFNKHPYMFYYITQLDATYRTLFFCLCDVNVIAPVNQNTIKEVVFDSKNISRVRISFSVPDEIATKLINKTFEYGEKVGEKESTINTILGNIFSAKPAGNNVNRINAVNGLPLSEMLEMYENEAIMFWNGMLEQFTVTAVPEFHVLQFMKQNSIAIKKIFNSSKIVGHLFINSNQITNLFLMSKVQDKPVCKECGETNIIVYKRFMKEISNKNNIFLPSFETYTEKKVLPSSQDYWLSPPVPIDTESDKWICPSCLKMHSFTISKTNKISFYKD